MTYYVNMINNRITSDLLRGHTDTIILRFLLEGDRYGYEITKLIQERSKNAYQLKEATMYSSLKRLEADRYIHAYWGDETKGVRRKYYQITVSGRKLYGNNKRNWDHAKQVLDTLL